MSVIAFKGFHADMTCRGYKFDLDGWNVEKKAGCVQCGFHAAENPLDCLHYYPDVKNSIYCAVECAGDVDEDACDSKIACTEMRIIKALSMEEFVSHAMLYVYKHPECRRDARIHKNEATARDGFCIAEGEDPRCRGEIGDVLGYIIRRGKKVVGLFCLTVDGVNIEPGKFYALSDIRGLEEA